MTGNDTRAVIFAYQAVGHACLERLLAIDPEAIVAVVTHRDDPGEERWYPSVGECALDAGIAMHYAEDFRPGDLGRLMRSVAPNLAYSFYYRRMLPRIVTETPSKGAYNLHGSLLPAYRGRCPANWVLVNQEKETGVTLHHMVAEADAGDIVGQTVIPIDPRETIATLYAKLVPAAADLLEKWHPAICAGTAPCIPQDSARATYFGGRRPEDGRIRWQQSSAAVDALVRAVTHPFPGAFTEIHQRRLFVWGGAPLRDKQREPGTLDPSGESLVFGCGEGSYRIETASWEGGPELSGAEIARQLRDAL